ncbi:MAG: hypothetical protein Q8Q26_14770 [Pseudorhodobacter sp.]|nr:hypothetical protein [Pseudorhodobacter sp.]
MIRYLLILVFASLSIAQPAYADWQYTKWGEAFSDLLSKPGVRRNNNSEKHTDGALALLKADYVASGVRTVAYFYFPKGDIDLGLSEVRLSDLPRTDCPKVVGELHRAYDRPDLETGTEFLEIVVWRKSSFGDDVSFMGIINPLDFSYVSCDVVYTPATSPGMSGGF